MFAWRPSLQKKQDQAGGAPPAWSCFFCKDGRQANI